MKRYAHYWWPLKGQRFPTRIAVLDCDGTPQIAGSGSSVRREELSGWTLMVSEFRAGAPIGSARYAGSSAGTLWARLRSLLSGHGKLWLFASPSSRILPLIGFWQRLEDGGITLAGRDRRAKDDGGTVSADTPTGVCVVADPPTVILCRVLPAKGVLLLLDIRNWGIDLLPEEMGANGRAREYSGAICSVVHTLRQSGFGSLRCTAGAQAVSSLRSDETCVRLHCHTHTGTNRLERESYYGGRSECYRIGEVTGPVYHLDVRSMYPSLCLDLPIPVSLRRYHATGQATESAGRSGAASMLARVRVKTTVPAYPLRRGGDVIFPVGEYDTYLCGPELSAAVAANHVTRWYSGAEYSCANVLRPYYERWLQMLQSARSSGNASLQSWIKRVMNALPGKFGEQSREWVDAPDDTARGPYGTWYERGPDGNDVRFRNIAWNTQREEVHGESYWSCPAIAAWITAAGRVSLWHYIEAAGRETVWYVDTDSLLCGQAGYDRLLHRGLIRDGETGYLRLIGRHSRCTIYGYRHYSLDDTVSCAGVPRGTIRPGETRGEYWWRQSAGDAIWHGRRPTGDEIRREYSRLDEYRHGEVMEEGSVQPWNIQE